MTILENGNRTLKDCGSVMRMMFGASRAELLLADNDDYSYEAKHSGSILLLGSPA